MTLTLTHTLPFRRQTVKVEVRTGAIVKRFRNFVAWVEPGPKTAFFAFKVPFDYPAHSLQETVLPQTNGTGGNPETLRKMAKFQHQRLHSVSSVLSCMFCKYVRALSVSL